MSDAVRVRDLHFRYPSAHHDALRGLTFSLRRGQVFGLLGPSGTGKSTTVGVLTGVLAGFRGDVSVLGAPGPADRVRLSRIGVGFEVPSLYARLTARENLELFAALHRTPHVDIDALLGRVGLHGQADHRVERFSKGMKGRLDLCRALIGSPELLFLDEPTAGQDPGHARVVRELVRDFADAGGAVLLTTHDMHVAEAICDQLGLLVDGRLVACDTPAALRAPDGPPQVQVELLDEPPRTVELAALADDPWLRDRLRTGQIRALHTREPTLEDVFLELTGRSLS